MLRTRGIRSLIITGVVTGGCVLMTAGGAMHHGYYPVVISDCVGEYDVASHELALRWMGTCFPACRSDEVIAAWRR